MSGESGVKYKNYNSYKGKSILNFFSVFTMNTGDWSSDYLNGLEELDKNTIGRVGCAVTVGANFTATVAAKYAIYKILNPGEINKMYCSDGIMNWSKLASDYGYSAERGYGELSSDTIEKWNNDRNNEYIILLDVNYKNTTSSHWVGYDGLDSNQFGNPSFRIGKSSDNDSMVYKNTIANKRQQLGWTERWNTNILVPRNQVKGYVVFRREQHED